MTEPLPRPTVYDIAERAGFPTDVGLMGRLDKETSGVIVMSDDPLLLRALTEPAVPDQPGDNNERKFGISVSPYKRKKYRLILCGEILNDVAYVSTLPTLLSEPFSFSKGGVCYETSSAGLELVRHWQDPSLSQGQAHMGWCVELSVTLAEGKHHQIRRMARRLRLHVVSLCRINIAGILDISSVPLPGQCRWLTKDEIKELYCGLGLAL